MYSIVDVDDHTAAAAVETRKKNSVDLRYYHLLERIQAFELDSSVDNDDEQSHLMIPYSDYYYDHQNTDLAHDRKPLFAS